jgi:PII-like signaling protein
MTLNRNCKILKIYVSEDTKYKGHNLYHALVHRLAEIGMAGVTVTRGIEGFGHEQRLHSVGLLDISLKLPIIIEIIDTAEKIEKAMPIINEMVNEGLVLVTDVVVLKYGKELTEE